MTERQPILTPEPHLRGLVPPLDFFAGSVAHYPRESNIVALFELAAEKFPERIALSFCGLELDYAGLNNRANRVAHHLIRIGVRPGMFVGICAERSPEMIVGILAILKAGGAYVPLDPAFPAERLDFLISDTQTEFILTQRHLAPSIAKNRAVTTVILEEQFAGGEIGDEQNPNNSATASRLAYVMYTSGSMGRPKGVLVEHRSILRLVFNTNYCAFGPDEVFLQLAPISFDASTFEIWGALLHGAKLVVMPPQAPSLQEIGDHVRNCKVSTLWLSAGLFHLFVDQRVNDLQPLRQLLAGGDTLSSIHVRKVLESCPELKLINGYGPTENTTFTCCHVMSHGDRVTNSVSIGRPISNTFVYLLNEELQPVAPGTVGEVCAGGDGVARGYLNSPELTAEKFLADPFSTSPNARMYRTGDLARWLPDGTLEFLGRSDHQVKILGHRIELGEIESVLAQHPAVAQACVVVRTDALGTKRLFGYYVPVQHTYIPADEIKSFVSAKLPAYMVPVSSVPMSQLPLTANGKVDRAALPMATDSSETLGPQARGTELEEKITSLWKEVLGTRRVGPDENFFDLGGDSLLIVAVHAQLQKLLQREIQVVDLFEYVTVRSLARHLGEAAAPAPTFAAAHEQARKQREALAKRRLAKGVTS